MEPGGSMPYSQRLSSIPYPEPNEPKSSYWYLAYFFKIHSNIDLQYRPNNYIQFTAKDVPISLRT